MIYKETKYKYWETNDEIISDFYALDTLKMMTKEKIKELNLKNDNGFSGRVNSSLSETSIVNIFNEIKDELFKYNILLIIDDKKASIEDFILEFNGRKILINIKITTGLSTDNSISWKTIVYLLNYNSNINKRNFAENIKKIDNIDNTNNYYFFVINKITNNIILNSLKTLNHLKENPSNQPFQIKWDEKNKEPNIEKYQTGEGIRHVLITAVKSLEKNIENETNMIESISNLLKDN